MKTLPPPREPAELTRFIESRYHARHRTQLAELAELSGLVEAVHAGDEHVPVGLAALLRRLIGELEVHMKKEELILFPAMRRAAGALDVPIAAMRDDHGDHAADVAEIGRLTNDLNPPRDACRSWTRLYAGLREFVGDLQEHIRLEDDVLFPQFETPGVHLV
ncbi:MAG: hemerythrin domain-containing protein [Flavobacteriaceae bacterium]